MIEDRTVIHERILENIDDSFDKTEGSFFYDATKPAAIELENQNIKIQAVEDKLSIENLEGDELAIRIDELSGVKRKVATYSSTEVTITGELNATIKIGDLVATELVNFVITEDKTIDETGEVIASVICEEDGSIGNVPIGAIKTFPVTLPGLNSVSNLIAVTDGYDAETDSYLLERHYEKLRTPATSGNKYHYMNWAKEITGVGDAKVFPLWDGNNTVKVIIINQDKLVAAQELVDEVQVYIDPGATGLGEGEAPIGAFCTIESATGKEIDISFTVIKDTSITDLIRQTNVESNLKEYFKTVAFESLSVSYAIIGATILNSEGVLDYSDLLVDGATSNIALTESEVPILGTVIINE